MQSFVIFAGQFFVAEHIFYSPFFTHFARTFIMQIYTFYQDQPFSNFATCVFQIQQDKTILQQNSRKRRHHNTITYTIFCKLVQLSVSFQNFGGLSTLLDSSIRNNLLFLYQFIVYIYILLNIVCHSLTTVNMQISILLIWETIWIVSFITKYYLDRYKFNGRCSRDTSRL